MARPSSSQGAGMRARSPRCGAFLLIFGLGAAAWADERPTDLLIGQKLGDFVLPAADDTTFRLHDLDGKKAAVLVFTGTQCPVGNLYMPRLVELAKSYGPKGVAFASIN